MSILYRLLTYIFYPIYRFAILPRRLKAHKEDPERYYEKLGFASKERSSKKIVWFHAASVGESLSLLKLIERFVKEQPDWQVLLTSGTITSAKMIEKRFPKQVIHQYAPLDFMPVITRFLSHWKPSLMVWVESELWPNMIFTAHKQKTPVILLNMRLSQDSFNRWLAFKKIFLKLLSCFDLILTQTKMLDENLKKIGCKNTSFCGNLKYAADIPTYREKDLHDIKTAFGKRAHWMAASTHKDEEEIVLASHKIVQKKQKNSCLILVVRHPNRCNEVESLLQKQGFTSVRYSQWQQTNDAIKKDVLLVDKMGLMGLFYELSTFVLVGGSLIDGIGGHNILEPMRQNCVTLHGSYMENFREIVMDAKTARACIGIQDSNHLAETILDLMDDSKKQQHYIKNANQFLALKTQVLDNVLTHFSPYLSKEAHHERA